MVRYVCYFAFQPLINDIVGGAIASFQESGHQLRVGMDRNALWFFIIAILSSITISFQNYLFASAAGSLTCKLRSLSFRAILRQDSQ